MDRQHVQQQQTARDLKILHADAEKCRTASPASRKPRPTAAPVSVASRTSRRRAGSSSGHGDAEIDRRYADDVSADQQRDERQQERPHESGRSGRAYLMRPTSRWTISLRPRRASRVASLALGNVRTPDALTAKAATRLCGRHRPCLAPHQRSGTFDRSASVGKSRDWNLSIRVVRARAAAHPALVTARPATTSSTVRHSTTVAARPGGVPARRRTAGHDRLLR